MNLEKSVNYNPKVSQRYNYDFDALYQNISAGSNIFAHQKAISMLLFLKTNTQEA